MHIKHISISNFRSFRQQPEIEAFSPGTNSVVGRNGSGKSNLFDAVQFCLLAPRFANLRQEERQALLHEGSGSAAVNAFVEIVFDNSDHRFTVEQSDEVVLRRTIGLHKDEFFLQRRRATKSEIQSLLEGAGFSKSNPYFIVQQGKVQDLCTMSDAERLALLQEVAGCAVYDEKKAESTRKMHENAASCEKIAELLQDMQERLEQLQSEKDELTAYTSLDRQRRAVEYSLYDSECAKARTLLEAVEQERALHVEHVRDFHQAAKETHTAIRQAEAACRTTGNARKRNRLQLQSLQQDHQEAVQLWTQLQLQCRELEDSFRSEQEVYQQNQKELERVQQEISNAQKELDENVQPAFGKATAELEQMMDERTAAVKQQEALYAKQGRGRQFESKQERDTFLHQNIVELETAKTEKESELSSQRDSLAAMRRAVEQESKDVDKLNSQVTQMAGNLKSITKAMDEKKSERLKLNDARKEEWRQSQELQEQVGEAREQYQRAVSDMRKAMPKATAMGLEALNTIVEQEGLVRGRQYFGTLMDNFTLRDDKYQTAVEVAAQNSLFHVIVDNDETASQLMTRLEQGKLGRVTFLPLSRLRIEPVKYPESNDVRPLLDICIQFDKNVERAMQHVFNKKLIARSPEIASEWSSKLGMDAITLDGDSCSRKGALTGGYVDSSKSRLRAHVRRSAAHSALKKAQSEYQAGQSRAQQAEQATTNLMQEVQRLEAKHAELSNLLADKETDLERLQSRLETHTRQVGNMESVVIPPLEKSISEVQGDIARLQEEMGTELTKTLSDEDRELLHALKQTLSDLGEKIEIQRENVATAGLERQKLQSLLQDNLLKRQKELSEGAADEDAPRRKSRLSSATIQAQRKEDLEDRHRQLEVQTSVKQDIEKRVEEGRRQEEKLRAELMRAKNELEQLKSQDMKNMKELEEAQDKSDRLLNKRTLCISKRETYIRKIQELGSLPPPAELEKVSGKSIKELMGSLHEINKELKKYSHVNKKAFDQYVNFSEQRDALLKRKEELDEGAIKVKELVDSLDRQKDEAINRTFRGVRSHFKDVFKELVPNGAGELVMRTAIDDGDGNTDGEESSIDESSVDESPTSETAKKRKADPDVSLYRGIGINIRFSEVGENYMMSQLSGGQKALVALALIFAIQRCDPAPFYLFDELDQALDSSYRAAVASLIQRQASSADNPTQFIVSTFRPELVAVANRCYGISHQNKVSSIHPLSKKDSLHFVASLMNEDEQLGEVTTVSTARLSRLTRESRKRKMSVSNIAEEGSVDSGDDQSETSEATSP